MHTSTLETPRKTTSLGFVSTREIVTENAAEDRVAVVRDAISRMKLLLLGNMRTYMKPSDVTYAEKLIKKSTLTDAELQWAHQFNRWYDAYNFDAVKREYDEHGYGTNVVRRAVSETKQAASTITANVRAKSSGPEAAADADEMAPPEKSTSPVVAVVAVGGLLAIMGGAVWYAKKATA